MVLRGGVGCIFHEERSCTGELFWEHLVYFVEVSYCVPSRLVSALLTLITIDFSLASLERFQNTPTLVLFYLFYQQDSSDMIRQRPFEILFM